MFGHAEPLIRPSDKIPVLEVFRNILLRIVALTLSGAIVGIALGIRDWGWGAVTG